MFKVGLENYSVLGKHGAYDFEHEYEQPFVVSIWVELNHNQFDDDLSKTINYADLQNIVHDVIVNSTPIRLMETMMSMMLEKLNKIISFVKFQSGLKNHMQSCPMMWTGHC